MEYKREQTTAILRRRDSIQAFRILDIRGDSIVIRNPYKREYTVEILVPKIVGGYNVGDYADIIFLRTGSAGYTAEVIGHTPIEFTPKNNIEIW